MKEFYRFSFFKAVHLLEALYPERRAVGIGLDPSKENVRFSVRPGLAFPPSDISAMKEGGDGSPARMEVAFMGLIGPSGVLPHWYNELALERNKDKDFGLTAFYDLFHHRIISLFYLAWKKHRFPESYLPGGRDKMSWYLMSLMGLGTPGLSSKMGMVPEPLIFCSGLLSRCVPSSSAIEAAVEYFSGAEVALDQFVGRWIPLDPEDQTRMGVLNGEIGLSAVCGSQVWDEQSRFRVKLGPLTYRKFLRFLPSGDLLSLIFTLVRFMAGIEFEFEIRVILKREEVPPCVLGTTTPSSPRLGWSTWIKHPGVTLPDHPYVTFEEQGM